MLALKVLKIQQQQQYLESTAVANPIKAPATFEAVVLAPIKKEEVHSVAYYVEKMTTSYSLLTRGKDIGEFKRGIKQSAPNWHLDWHLEATNHKFEENTGGQVPQEKGKMVYKGGNQYEGEWKDGKKHGIGTLISPTGAKYTGEWKDDLMCGYGTWTNPDKSTHVGKRVFFFFSLVIHG